MAGRSHAAAYRAAGTSRSPASTGCRDARMAVDIEHEHRELGQLEGLRQAAATLLAAGARRAAAPAR